MSEGRRAPVQGEPHRRPPIPAGTIAWEEHLAYHAKWGNDQSAETIAARFGFGYSEIVDLIGGPPKTWEARR
jgi:hypothetical protein